jgi:hypothetical protein
MVPLGVHDLLLRDAERTLKTLLEESADDVDRAFVAYVGRSADWVAQLEEAATRARGRRGAERSYRDVAVLGFSAEVSGNAASELRDAADWLAGTSPMVAGLPTGIVEDRVALLGVALAARQLGGDSPLHRWLPALVALSERDTGIDSALLRATAAVLSINIAFSPGAPEAELALAHVGLLPRNSADAAAVVNAMLRGDLASEPRRAALQLTALAEVRARLPTIDVARATPSDIAALLRRVPVALQQWTWEERAMTRGGLPRKWHMEHEYHVQNLLWALLAPVFPDLRREEYTEPVGPLQPRVDLGIPSLRLVIEVKFWRDTLTDARLVEQIAADSSVYFTGSERRYDDLLVFVWDNARRTELHDGVIRGLRALPRVQNAVIVPRPGKMNVSIERGGTA